jgi:hypothetical protein
VESGEVGVESEKRAPQPKKKAAGKLKTQASKASVAAFLDGIADEQRRKDAFTVLALMKKVTKAEPKMWGPAIVGFGDRRLRYPNGRVLDWFRAGFSPRKAALTLYLMGGLEPQGVLLKTLGKHKTGKGCLYIRNLNEIDMPTLTALIRSSVSRPDETTLSS